MPAHCGSIPTSSGPAGDLATLQVSAPESGLSGGVIAVLVSVVVQADGPRVVTDPTRSLLLLTLGDQVVGRAADPAAGLPVPLPLRAGTVRPAQAVPGSMVLAGCPTGPAGERAPLPPGSYGVVAVLGYGQDQLNGTPAGGPGGQFQLVSQPVWITVV